MAGAYSSAFSTAFDSGGNVVAGVLFSRPPAFISGVVTTGNVTVTGVLFSRPPSFITGVVTKAGILDGVVFLAPPSFVSGTVNLASADLFSGWGVPIGV